MSYHKLLRPIVEPTPAGDSIDLSSEQEIATAGNYQATMPHTLLWITASASGSITITANVQKLELTIIHDVAHQPLRIEVIASKPEQIITVRELFLIPDGAMIESQTALVMSTNHTTGILEQYALLNHPSRSSIEGAPVIEAAAHNTSNHLHQEGLLMNSQARLQMTPLLAVANNEVSAGHSFQLTQLSTEDEYYAATRGVDAQTLRTLLADGMLSRALAAYSSDELESLITRLI